MTFGERVTTTYTIGSKVRCGHTTPCNQSCHSCAQLSAPSSLPLVLSSPSSTPWGRSWAANSSALPAPTCTPPRRHEQQRTIATRFVHAVNTSMWCPSELKKLRLFPVCGIHTKHTFTCPSEHDDCMASADTHTHIRLHQHNSPHTQQRSLSNNMYHQQ